MKRATKTWLVIAAVLVLIGTVVFVGAVNRWDFAEYEDNTIAVNEAFQNISIHTDTEDIAFVMSDDGECRVVFHEQEKVKHTASVQNGTLFIDVADAREWYEHIAMSFGFPAITVYLPQNEYALLSIEESTGDIVIPKGFVFERIDIVLSTGDVECNASASGMIRVKTSTGDIHIDDITAGTIELSASTGRIEAHSVVCEGNMGVTVSTGKTILTEVSCRSIISNGSTGEITLEKVIASNDISIERSTGDVNVEQCDAGELYIKTVTGDITGSLLSEKVFIAQSHTGRVEVPETTSGGKCKIVTENGDISIAIL